jgi:transposase
VLQSRGIGVVVANTRTLGAISEAKAKTDRLDARTLARLLASGLLDRVWTPDERTRMLRRLTSRRERLVRARTRAKHKAHGVLARNLCERPPRTDAFGPGGLRWLAELELPLDERFTRDGCLRQVAFLDREVAALDAEIAKQALAWPEVLRLMMVAGVNLHTAATFMASVGDISRFSSPQKLVSYLGLDPRVRQSGGSAARHGRISNAGASEARHMLGEVAWKVTMTPGPLRAFFERVRARRGPQIAATATARKLAVLFWQLLGRGEDYAYARPAMTRNKIRRLELLAGAPAQKGRKGIGGNRVYHPRTHKQINAREVIGGPPTYATEAEAERAEADASTLLRSNARIGVTVREFWTDWTTDPLWQRPSKSTNLHNRERTSKFVMTYGDLPDPRRR